LVQAYLDIRDIVYGAPDLLQPGRGWTSYMHCHKFPYLSDKGWAAERSMHEKLVSDREVILLQVYLDIVTLFMLLLAFSLTEGGVAAAAAAPAVVAYESEAV